MTELRLAKMIGVLRIARVDDARRVSIFRPRLHIDNARFQASSMGFAIGPPL